MLIGEEFSGATETGLNLVSDKKNVVLFANGRRLGKVSNGRNQDTGLTLDGFDKECGGVRRDCCT